MATDQAIAAGAEALFGEKYGDEVRVLSMGADLGRADKAYSVELCGGTHVRRLGDIGLVHHPVAKARSPPGVRRIEALTGERARRYLAGQAEIAREGGARRSRRRRRCAGARRGAGRGTPQAGTRTGRSQEAAGAGGGPAQGGGDGMRDDRRRQGRAAQLVEGVAPKDLKSLADDAKKPGRLRRGGVRRRGRDGKACVVVGVTDDLTRASARSIWSRAAEALGGKGGGGRPDMAQAGGPDGAKAQEALAAVEAALDSRGQAPAAVDAIRRCARRPLEPVGQLAQRFRACPRRSR